LRETSKNSDIAGSGTKVANVVFPRVGGYDEAMGRTARILLSALLLGPVVSVVSAEPGVATAQDALGDRLAGLVNDFLSERGHVQVGVAVVDLCSGRSIYAWEPDRPLAPASNQKLLTSAFALETLGSDFAFTTRLLADGRDLRVVGDFDPLLADPVLADRNGTSIYAELDRWSRTAAKHLPDGRAGSLTLQVPFGPESYRPTDWAKRHRYRWFGAPVAGLNFHDNCYDVTFAERDGRIVPLVAPASSLIQIVNRTQPGPKQRWRLRSNPAESEVVLSGTVRSASPDPISAPMANPPAVLGRVLADRLERAGVAIDGPVKLLIASGNEPPNGTELARTRTPIADVVARANERSLNLAAECLLLRAGRADWNLAAETMRTTLLKRFDLHPDALRVRDGSGLSETNRVSAGNIVRLLNGATQRKWFGILLASLPRSGQSGTLRRRLRGPGLTGRIAAKTGYIRGVVCLSGYALDAQGRPRYAVSALLNGVRNVAAAKTLQDRLCGILIQAADTPQRR
jgi:serine-type D-Ala-D-Ala carboxypeptidase/endopeptidase (penicillin-binding protein 4)